MLFDLRRDKRDLRSAQDCAEEGGQALLIMPGVYGNWPGGPRCFRNREIVGKLFDQDIERLRTTARSLGVKRIKPCRIGNRGQHVDLCGKPLERAVVQAVAAKESFRHA